MKSFLAFAVVLVQSQTLYASILLNKEYLSPNSRYSATIEYVDDAYHFAIKSRSDGSVLLSRKYEDVISYLKWEPNSKAIVAIHHLAGASYLSVFVERNQRWNGYECDISEAKSSDDEFQHSYVHRYDIRDNKLNVFFVCQVQSATTYETKRCVEEHVVMVLSNGKITRRIKEKISYDLFERRLSTAPWTNGNAVR